MTIPDIQQTTGTEPATHQVTETEARGFGIIAGAAMQNLPPNPSEQLSRLEQQALDTALHDFLREIFVSQGEPAYERAMEDFIRLNSEIGRYPAIKKLTEVPIPTSQPDGVVSPDAPLSVE